MNSFDECLDYFRKPGFNRFHQAWLSKYKRLGHLGGKIKLTALSSLEKETLGLFLGMDLSMGELEITYHQFLKRFNQTKFEGIDYFDILMSLYPGVQTNQEERDLKQDKQSHFKATLLEKYQDTKAYDWLAFYLNHDGTVNKNIESLDNYEEILSLNCEALNQLPCFYHDYLLLPVFSQRITKNPHYFDDGIEKELLLKGIEFILDIKDKRRTVEDINDILYQAGLLRDDLSNNCYICHLKPVDDIAGWAGFYDNVEPWNMNLYNLMQVSCLFKKSAVYMVENPAVFRTLVDFIKEEKLDIGLICSNGQINLCTYMLVDKLIESQCCLYYAGDFDPEGLQIADKLKQRCQEKLNLWCYDTDYFQSYGLKRSSISKKRRHLLENIKDSQLKEIANKIMETSSFIYQEGLVDVYKEDLRKELK